MSEQPQPPTEAAFFTSIREWGLVRGTSGVVGGVVEGVGNKIGLARVPARLLTVVAWILLPGIVMVAYAAGWALLPDARGNIIIQNFGRGVTNVGALIGIAILSLLGILGFDNGPVLNFFTGNRGFYSLNDVPFGLAAVLIPIFLFLTFVTGVVVLIVWLVKRSNSSTADAPVKTPTNAPSAAGSSSETASSPAVSAATANGGAFASSGDATSGHTAQQQTSIPGSTTGTPQPWEPALLPGDPRAGVAASASTTRASAAHSANNAPHTAHTPATGQTATSQAGPTSVSAAPPPPPVRPAQPARPPAPTVPGPGPGGYLAFVAVLVLSAALVTALAWDDQLAVSPVIAWGAAITVGLGATLVIVALAGRKLGFLGFLSVFAVLLSVLFAANAETIRDTYASSENWFGVDEDVVIYERVDEEQEVTVGFDLTAKLANDYSTVFLAGACTSPSDVASWSDATFFGESMATMRLDTVDEDIDVGLPAAYTRLAIPAGTSLEIVGSGHTTVVWERRDASCSTWVDPDVEWEGDLEWEGDVEWDGESEMPGSHIILTATNPDTAVITVNAGAGKTIYIEEVAK